MRLTVMTCLNDERPILNNGYDDIAIWLTAPKLPLAHILACGSPKDLQGILHDTGSDPNYDNPCTSRASPLAHQVQERASLYELFPAL